MSQSLPKGCARYRIYLGIANELVTWSWTEEVSKVSRAPAKVVGVTSSFWFLAQFPESHKW